MRFRLSICRAIHRVLDLLVAVEYSDVGQMVGVVVDPLPVELDQVGPEERAWNPIAQQIRPGGQETLDGIFQGRRLQRESTRGNQGR